MNILMNALPALSGGAVSYSRNLTPLLAEQFGRSQAVHRLTVLAHESQKPLFEGLPDEMFHWIGGERPMGWRRLLWERRNIKAIASETRADALFTPYQVGPKVSGIRQVLMIRNMEPFLHRTYPYSVAMRLRNEALARASARGLRGADRVIAVSNFARAQLEDGLSIPSNRIRTIYHGRAEALELAQPTEAASQTLAQIGVMGPFLLTCGSLLPYRRCEDVIAAFDRLAVDLPDNMQLVIAGSGSDRRYRELIHQAIDASANRDRIRAVGHVPSETMAALYHHCRVCIIATEIEACPNIAIEAMTAGCVIVASDKPPLPEIFDDASVIYRARDVEDLAAAIGRALRDETLRQEMPGLARRRAKRFSWRACADKTYQALTDWP